MITDTNDLNMGGAAIGIAIMKYETLTSPSINPLSSRSSYHDLKPYMAV